LKAVIIKDIEFSSREILVGAAIVEIQKRGMKIISAPNTKVIK